MGAERDWLRELRHLANKEQGSKTRTPHVTTLTDCGHSVVNAHGVREDIAREAVELPKRNERADGNSAVNQTCLWCRQDWIATYTAAKIYAKKQRSPRSCQRNQIAPECHHRHHKTQPQGTNNISFKNHGTSEGAHQLFAIS